MLLPELLTDDKYADMLSRSPILHCTFESLKSSIFNIMIDSIYSSLLYCVNTVLTPIAKLSMMFITEVLSYIIDRGVDSRRVTFHTRCTVSLFDCIEQLYVIVSPGQSISDLIVFVSSRSRETVSDRIY